MAEFIITWISNNLVVVTLALAIAMVIVVIILISLLFRLGKLASGQKLRVKETTETDLDAMLRSYLTKVEYAEKKVDELSLRTQKIEAQAQKSLQNVSLLRFNAFENTGGDLSFAAAFLDLNGDGLVISSINSREESRVYAKPVENCQSSYTLSKEEIEAIKQAIARATSAK